MSADDFRPIGELIAEHARARPGQPALVMGDERLSWAALDALMDRVAASLQRDGLRPGDALVLGGGMSPRLMAVFLGALRAGVVVAPLACSVTPAVFAAMRQDADPKRLVVDAQAAPLLAVEDHAACIALDAEAPGTPFERWLLPEGSRPAPVAIRPEDAFNIIYSSGTTGTPKGIVQPHGMRWLHIQRGAKYGYGPDTVTLLSTPLYSNTTLVVAFPTLGFGGTVHLQPKFDAGAWLAIAERERVTHTMLVPVQYRRLLAHPDFDRRDLSTFQIKFCTSAPFAAEVKAEVLRRWPGGLVEFYGMTEGGGTCILDAHLHPDKLHTVGRPADGHDLRLIDEAGVELPPERRLTEGGEVVGRSGAMMAGYHGRPELTREAEWFSPEGLRFIRTGDIGRFDAEGFLTLFDRRKDMIISGGFNLYPSDLEAELRRHPAVVEAAVVGVPSAEWGETPVAFVERRLGDATSEAELRDWLNQRVGKTQRLSELRFVDELPRSAIGKLLKRELRERWAAQNPPSFP
ncbi:MAG TPA: class I adenylate-forming enzyme family protein [Burkholderiaceae bacterium]|nr:class I adenylate-forming enzyme family protein [Burkholderiaceae bacterium]HNB45923.1 class I adenylate-forming enzyme family protein [Burkholderiaceae bacterium]HNG79187.1 class I adenylate-forming enzyme family protein [Burkholderiaceae bacterium]